MKLFCGLVINYYKLSENSFDVFVKKFIFLNHFIKTQFIYAFHYSHIFFLSKLKRFY